MFSVNTPSHNASHPKAAAWLLRGAIAVLLPLMLGACAGAVDTQPMSAPEVPMAFTAKVDGTWALVVGGGSLNTQIAAPGFACGGLTFPIDMDTLFRRYLLQGFHQVAANIVTIDHVATPDELRSHGYAGQIVIDAATLRPDVAFAQHGLTAYVGSNIELTATLDVSGRGGPLLHRALSVTGISNVDAGIICQDGSRAIARAVDSAMQQVSVASASAFGDSPAIRLAASRVAAAGR